MCYTTKAFLGLTATLCYLRLITMFYLFSMVLGHIDEDSWSIPSCSGGWFDTNCLPENYNRKCWRDYAGFESMLPSRDFTFFLDVLTKFYRVHICLWFISLLCTVYCSCISCQLFASCAGLVTASCIFCCRQIVTASHSLYPINTVLSFRESEL